jgi:hypothetical protein
MFAGFRRMRCACDTAPGMWSCSVVSRGFWIGSLTVLLAGAPASAQESERSVGSRAARAREVPNDPAPWILAGSGAALCLAGAVLYGVGVSDIAVVNSAAPGTEWSSVAGIYETAPVLTGMGLAALAAGGAMALAGTVWRVAGQLSSREPADRPGAHLWLGLRGTSLALGGSF